MYFSFYSVFLAFDGGQGRSVRIHPWQEGCQQGKRKCRGKNSEASPLKGAELDLPGDQLGQPVRVLQELHEKNRTSALI